LFSLCGCLFVFLFVGLPICLFCQPRKGTKVYLRTDSDDELRIANSVAKNATDAMMLWVMTCKDPES
jgi:hypothetical protein